MLTVLRLTVEWNWDSELPISLNLLLSLQGAGVCLVHWLSWLFHWSLIPAEHHAVNTHTVCATSYIIATCTQVPCLQQQFHLLHLLRLGKTSITVKRVIACNLGWLLSENSFIPWRSSAQHTAHWSQGRPGNDANQTSMWSGWNLESRW